MSQIAIRGKRQCQQNESEFCNASRVWSSCNNYCFFLFQKETLTKCFLQTALYWPHHFFWPPALPASTTAAEPVYRNCLELIPVLGSQPAGGISHKPGGRLPLGYFPLGPQLPSQPLRGLLPISLLGEQRHNGCEQFA